MSDHDQIRAAYTALIPGLTALAAALEGPAKEYPTYHAERGRAMQMLRNAQACEKAVKRVAAMEKNHV